MADKPNLTSGIKKDSDVRKENYQNVQRKAIRVEPKTIISQSKPQSGYKNPTTLTSGQKDMKPKKVDNNANENIGGGGVKKQTAPPVKGKNIIQKQAEKPGQRKPISATQKTVISNPTPHGEEKRVENATKSSPSGTTEKRVTPKNTRSQTAQSVKKTSDVQKKAVEQKGTSITKGSTRSVGEVGKQTTAPTKNKSVIQKQAEKPGQRKPISATQKTVISNPTPHGEEIKRVNTKNPSPSGIAEKKVTPKNTRSQTAQSVKKTSERYARAIERAKENYTPIDIPYFPEERNEYFNKKRAEIYESYNELIRTEIDPKKKEQLNEAKAKEISRLVNQQQKEIKEHYDQFTAGGRRDALIEKSKTVALNAKEKRLIKVLDELDKEYKQIRHRETKPKTRDFKINSSSGSTISKSSISLKATSVVTQKVKSGAMGVYRIGEKTIRVAKTVDCTIGLVRAGAIPLNKETVLRFKKMAVNKIEHSKIVNHISEGIKIAKKGVSYISNTMEARGFNIRVSSRTVISRPNLSRTLNKAKRQAQRILEAQDDSGTSAVSYSLAGAFGAVKVIKTSQKTSDFIIKNTPIAIKKIQTGVVGAYRIGEKTVRVVKAVDSTIGLVKAGVIPLNKETALRLKNMAVNKIVNSQVAKRISNGIKNIGEAVSKGVDNVKRGVAVTKKYAVKLGRGVVRTAVLARGFVYGTVTIKISRDSLKRIAKKTIPIIGKGMKISGKAVVNGGVIALKGGNFVVRKGIKAGKLLNGGINYLGDMCVNGNSFEAQAVGYTLKSLHYTVKGIGSIPKVTTASYRGVKTSVKGLYRGGKYVIRTGINTYGYVRNAVFLAKEAGGKVALKYYAKRWAKSFKGRAVNALRKAGGSMANLAIDLLKKLGRKVLLPLLVIIVGYMGITNMIDGIAGFVVAIFSPFISDDGGNEIDESAWLTSKITEERNELIKEVKKVYEKNLAENHGDYHYVRFYNLFENVEIELTDTNIANNIYSVSEYQEYIQPIFHTVLLSEYDLEASEGEMKNVFKNIWSNLSEIKTEELPTEYCAMTKTDNEDGTYVIDPILELDGMVHADLSLPCPNHGDLEYHTNDLNNPLCSCDYIYWECLGHKGELKCGNDFHYHGDGSCNTNVCGGKEEHTHSRDCCSKPIHTAHSSYCVNRCGTCGSALNADGSCPKLLCWHLYDYWSCGGLHSHGDGSCNTNVCGGKEEHNHSRECCAKIEHSHISWTDADNAGCYYTSYCGGELSCDCGNAVERFKCMGYYVCDGHEVLKLMIELKDFDDLIDKYYQSEINSLKAKNPKTTEEIARLNELQDYKEVCLEYANILVTEYGIGGGTVIDLEGVTLTALTDFACQYIGNPYLYGGTDPENGIDCSAFVQYVYANFGVSLPRVSKDQVKCGTTIYGIENAKAGDLIFWSDNGTDDGVYHVAIYLGDNLIVHASNSKPYPAGGIKVSEVYGTIHKIKRIAE